MKTFLLGVVVGIVLACAGAGVIAFVKQHRLAQVEQSARAAAVAAETAAARAPSR